MTEPEPIWKSGFLFLGNELVLDFLNTRPVPNGEPIELLSDFAAFARWLEAAGVLRARDAARIKRQWNETPRSRGFLESARALREMLRKEVIEWEAGAVVHPGTLAELNRLLTRHPMRVRLKATPEGVVEQPWFTMDEPEDLLAPIAESAAKLFTRVNRERVRKCAACALHFHDTSKKSTRRWCSMQLCGNRAKVAAYAERQRND